MKLTHFGREDWMRDVGAAAQSGGTEQRGSMTRAPAVGCSQSLQSTVLLRLRSISGARTVEEHQSKGAKK